MVGIDLHDSLIFAPTPAGVAPQPVQPHVVAGFLRYAIFGLVTGKPNMTVLGDWGALLSRGTDIGLPGLPHWQVSPPFYDLLTPLYIAGAGSKSEWGAHSVMLAQGQVAAAVLFFVNFNLNCCGATIPPTFTGLVIAPSTIKVGMTWGDIIAGYIAGIFDSLLQYGLNQLFGRIFPPGSSKLAKQLLMAFLQLIGSTFGTGTPLGYSPGYTPIGQLGDPISAGHDKLQELIDSATGEGKPSLAPPAPVTNYFNNPAVPTLPSAAPAPAGS